MASSTELDLRGFPLESLVERTLALCLGCALKVLTRHMGLSAQRAQPEIRRYNSRLEELTTASLPRPYLLCPQTSVPIVMHPQDGICR